MEKKAFLDWADGQLTLAVWLPIALSMSLMWSRASSLQFSGLGQTGTHRHVRNSRKENVLRLVLLSLLL